MKSSKFYQILILLISFLNPVFAQTTINTTVSSSGYTGSNNSGTGAWITFVIQNSSGGDILLTNVGNWTTTAHNGTTSGLWYSSTSLSGTVSSTTTIPSPPWTFITSATVSGITSTGVHTVLTGVNFLIPNGATYRFALTTTGTNYYSGSGVGTCSPNTFTASGVSLKTGDFQISGSYVGYGYTNNPRFFTGSITFTSACTSPTGLAASNVTNNSATLTWNSVPSSQGYEYVFDNTAANPSGSGTPTSSTAYNATGLSPNTTYYMHVRNKCSSSSYSGWITTSFTTINFISCYAPATVSGSNMTSSTGTISWTPVAGSQGYEYKIDQTATGPSSGWTSTTGTSVNFTGLTGGTTYYAHIRNICQPTDKSAWMNYQFIMPTCNKPVNVLISNVTGAEADILWSQMLNANGYDYAVDFSNQPPANYSHTTGITTHLVSLIPNSKYYIHVRSRCFAVDSSGWRLDSFITKMVCYAPNVQVNFLGTDNPYAYWDPVPTAVGYEYALTNTSALPAFGNNIAAANISLNLPEDGKDYYLHVRTKCNSQFTFSLWTTVALRTGSTGINIQGNKPNLVVYPNPVQNILYVQGETQQATYEITDIAGKMLLHGTLPDNNSSSPVLIDVNSLSTGFYLLKLHSSGNDNVVKIMK